MRKTKPFRHLLKYVFVAMSLLVFHAGKAQTDTVMIDFGPVSGLSDLPWNNFSETQVTGAQTALFDSELKATPFKIELTDRLSGFNTQGVASPDAALGFPESVTLDSYYGNTVTFSGALEPTGGFVFSGLDPAESYTVIIYAGRAHDENREGKYTLVGATTVEGSLNPANNTTNTLSLTVNPKADGTLELNVTFGDNNASSYKFFYLNGMKIVYNDITYAQPALTVTSPNGGEQFEQGSSQTISWTGENLTEDIEISYSSDNGSTWVNLATVANTVTSYDWTVPDVPSANYLVKLNSFTAEDQSDAVFQVLGEIPQLDTVLIDFGPVEMLSDMPWNNITSFEASDYVTPLYDSQLKATPFGVRITDRFGGINDGGITNPDISIGFPETATRNSFYGCTADFYGVLEPTGGLQLSGLDPAKSYQVVIYAGRTASDNRETKYTLEGISTVSGSLNASNNTSSILELDVSPKADGTIDILVEPGENNNNSYEFYYLNAIKIIYDDIVYAQPSISLTSPNGGEQYAAGTTQTISWTGENLVEDIHISYSENNGGTWIKIDTVAATETSLEWTIPETPSANYLVKVKSLVAEDISDATFEVLGELPELDTIMIDLGSETNMSLDPWNNITDNNAGTKISNLKNSNNLQTAISIEIIDRFLGVNENGTTSALPQLKLPGTASGDSFFGNTVDWSGIEPTGGFRFEGMDPSKTYTFEIFASRMSASDNREAKYVFTGSVKDSVYLNAASNESNIASISVIPDAEGKIQVIASPGENNNNSYNFFYFGALKIIYDKEDPLPSSIAVTSPNGAEDWLVGSDHEITWEAVNVTEDFVVSYSTDNGTGWTEINTFPLGETSFTWNVPDAISDQCLIKVVSGAYEDVSDAVFSISSAGEPKVIIEQPNGGEQWVSGTVQNISWTANMLIDNIVISYSVDNGSNWTIIETAGTESGSISWTVPDTKSTECLVKLESGAYSDVSASTFSIIDAPCSNTIVVLGSSTAAGSGVSVIDSAWVWRYTDALADINEEYEVINLAVGGYTTFKIVPTGTEFDEGVTATIDENRNVTKAVSYSPFAIIVNMPSNDASSGYTAEQTLANLKLVYDYAGAHGVETWIATTQPRNFSDPAKVAIQETLASEITNIYQDYALDFWTDLADDDGFIVTDFDSGDGVHLNDAGHKLLFERVMEKGIHMHACDTGNAVPVSTVETYAKIKVYPNPVQDQFTLSFFTEAQADVEISFMDITGKEIGPRTRERFVPGTHELTFSCEQLHTKSSVIFGAMKIDDGVNERQEFVKIIIQ